MRFIILLTILSGCIYQIEEVKPIINISARYVDIKDLGVIPSKTIDQRDRIQFIIDSIGSGNVLYFPKGTYKLYKNLKVKKALSFVGDGGSSVLDFTGKDNGIIFEGTRDAMLFNCRVTDMRIINSSDGSVANSGITFKYTYNNYLSGIYVAGFHNNIFCKNTRADKFERSYMAAYRINAMLFINDDPGFVDSGDRTIDDINFAPNSFNALTSIKQVNGGGMKIVNCKFNGGNYKVANHYKYVGSALTVDLIISNNSFENYGQQAIYVDKGTGAFSDVTINGNQFAYGGIPTIYMTGIQGLSIVGNVFRGNGNLYAVSLDGCSNGIILNAYSSYSLVKPILLVNCVNIRTP